MSRDIQEGSRLSQDMPKASSDANNTPLLAYCDGRKMITLWRPDIEELKVNIRQLFMIPEAHDVRISTKLAMFEDEDTEIDPKSWPLLKNQVTRVWVSHKATIPVISSTYDQNSLEDHPYHIYFKDLDGTTRTLTVKISDTVYSVKLKVQGMRGIPVSEQRLIHAGRQMEDEHTLRDHKVTMDATIHLVLRLKGGKPVIYLFSPISVEARISLELVPQWSFSALYPTKKIEETSCGGEIVNWNVDVRPDGILLDKDAQTEVSYLYWEAKSNPSPLTPAVSRSASPALSTPVIEVFNPALPIINASNSVLLSIEAMPLYLDKALHGLGLHTEARTSFITYWLPDFLKHQHIALRFLPQSVYEKSAPMIVTPLPAMTIRVFMLWYGVPPCRLEDWAEAANRAGDMDVATWKSIVGVPAGVGLVSKGDGLRVLEWGGMEVR